MRSQKEACGLSTYSPSRGMTVKDTRDPRISLLAAWRVSTPGPVSLCHTLLTAALNGPLSQRMPSSSSSQSHVFFQELPEDFGTHSLKGSLSCQPVLSLRHLKETGQSDCHLLQPSGRRKLLLKNMFLLQVFCSFWESHKDPEFNILYTLSSALLLLSLATSPRLSHSCLLF